MNQKKRWYPKSWSAVPKSLLWIFVGLLCWQTGAQAQQTIPDDVLDIFDENCAFSGCHFGPNAPKNLDLTEEAAFARLVGVKSAEMPKFLRIKPGDPQNSYIIKKLLGSADIRGERMPKGSKPLTKSQIAAIARWIQSLPPETRPQKITPTYARAFPGWTLANLPTAETPAAGAFVYRISHRFKSPTRDGFARLFGLDGGAFMMTQIGIPISNQLAFTLGRSAINATFELNGKWRILREKTDGSVPVSVALFAGVEWATLKEVVDPADPSSGNFLSRTDGERFSYFAQLPISRALGSRLSLLAVPGVLFNGNINLPDEDPLVTLGLGAKFNFNPTYALFVETVPILSGEESAAIVGTPRIENGKRIFNDTFTTGIEIKAGGHVFHVFITNSGGNTTNQYMSGGNFDFADGEFRLGFNIYRVLNYPFGH